MPRKNYLIFALLLFCIAVAPAKGENQCGASGCHTCEQACENWLYQGAECLCDGPEGHFLTLCGCFDTCERTGLIGYWPDCYPNCTSDCAYNATQTVSCGALTNGTYNGTQTCNALKGGVAGCYTWGGTTGCARVCNGGYYLNGTSCSQCPNITAQGWGPSMYGNSAAGSTTITSCYIPGGTTGISDGTGTFTSSGNCAYSN